MSIYAWLMLYVFMALCFFSADKLTTNRGDLHQIMAALIWPYSLMTLIIAKIMQG